MHLKICPLILMACAILACNRTEKYYYDTGELAVEISNLKDDEVHKHFQSYYKTGELKEEGLVIDNKKIGHWVEYYQDGEVKWQGDYFQNGDSTLCASDTISDCTVLWENKEVGFRLYPQTESDDTIRFRIVIEGLRPDDNVVGLSTDGHGLKRLSRDVYDEYVMNKNDVPLLTDPNGDKYFEIMVFFLDKDCMITEKNYACFHVYIQEHRTGYYTTTDRIEFSSNLYE